MSSRQEKTIKVSVDVHQRLKDLRWELREETFDGVINKLIDSYEKNQDQ